MKLHIARTLNDGTTLALLQHSHSLQKMRLRLVRLPPGMNAMAIRRIDQREGGIEVLREWTAPWNPRPGPKAKWTLIQEEGKAKLDAIATNLSSLACQGRHENTSISRNDPLSKYANLTQSS